MRILAFPMGAMLLSCAGPKGATEPAHADGPAARHERADGKAVEPRAERPQPEAPESGAAQGRSCDDGRCQQGLVCVKYYGIAGRSGPLFTSCEIPCGPPDFACPEGQVCGTIADGPGQVCRPQKRR